MHVWVTAYMTAERYAEISRAHMPYYDWFHSPKIEYTVFNNKITLY